MNKPLRLLNKHLVHIPIPEDFDYAAACRANRDYDDETPIPENHHVAADDRANRDSDYETSEDSERSEWSSSSKDSEGNPKPIIKYLATFQVSTR